MDLIRLKTEKVPTLGLRDSYVWLRFRSDEGLSLDSGDVPLIRVLRLLLEYSMPRSTDFNLGPAMGLLDPQHTIASEWS